MPPFATDPLMLLLVAVVSYVLGSVAFGPVMARVFGLGDLRKIGSGNIGATNVLRTGNKLAAFLTLVLDAGKGGIAVLIARALFAEDAAQVAGFSAFVGHLLPVFLGFKGGKGVATVAGTLLALYWPVGLAAFAIWIGAAAATRISSLGAIVAAVATPVVALLVDYRQGIALCVAFAVLVLLRHSGNIKRIMAGTEPRIGKSRRT